ncbi:monofunctional biosynthetic peptidoglycan transglycosylase [Rhodophyticola sp. CCM32]|uniref:monofunctional biosynthetic peptidoglycan transglycosylase n=1 Tax=Rhodophyticola sp. CCM32 TaxID=2916397 RepID=UPI00107EF7D1|nr:monofunctional biosynthetic peptidoglycan transglycosylase [Rhodophyticola sp. CCM32]QBY01963.1 monofunctional biosynthetic peptidoglycan transglycosylase [Rhodophyticola sp. CCM32]
MAKRATSRKKTSGTRRDPSRLRRGIRHVVRRVWQALAVSLGLILVWVALYAIVPVPVTPYMISQSWRHGGVDRDWVPMEQISPDLQRAVVAAEDANFCLHWGFDMGAIRDAIADGGTRGASTISQQTVKNAFLWQGRSWVRKALEAAITPVVELIWSKRRVLEVYLNLAEFDTGVFGAEAAAQHYFGVAAADLTPVQGARLAAILPSPQRRSASNPGDATRRRAGQILDGAATIHADGRDDCFAN